MSCVCEAQHLTALGYGVQVQFELPAMLATAYGTEVAWVLCLRAHIDAGPTDVRNTEREIVCACACACARVRARVRVCVCVCV